MDGKLAGGLVAIFAIAATISGCWRGNPTDATADQAAAPPEPAAASAPAAVAPAKTDPVSAADLKAGLAAIAPRVTATADGYEKVAPRHDSRYALHPDTGKAARIEFDVKGLRSLRLSPYIAEFSTVPDCNGSPDAGVVRMRWSLDGRAPTEIVVDRKYAGTIDVDTSGASRLNVQVDEGNGVHWCDWFGLGVVNVERE